ncbi:hypothetical protein DdX_16101 [Ditylenchus destructor]|uniref:Uncharacterized protein n=1 Tax=Ditylenchus destructor TaxID=166010 RepID=A0AAD4MQ74_9BILA|nr:hypothetical protein DdX_16101 [Ditylenchus destructor]
MRASLFFCSAVLTSALVLSHAKVRDAEDDDWVRRDMDDDDDWPLSRVDEEWQRADSWSDDNPGENNGPSPGGPVQSQDEGPVQSQDEGQEQSQGEYSPEQESDDHSIPIAQDDEEDVGRQPIPGNQGPPQAGVAPRNPGSSQTQPTFMNQFSEEPALESPSNDEVIIFREKPLEVRKLIGRK